MRARHRRQAVGLALLLGTLAACAPQVQAPAPVVSGGTAERSPATVTIQHGQTLSEIAHTYHVPMRVIAEANGLSPPYRIQTGRTLVIPGGGAPGSAETVASLPPAAGGAAPVVQRLESPAAVPSQSPSVTATPLPPATSAGAVPAGETAPPPAQAASSGPPPVSPEAAERSAMPSGSPPPAARTNSAFVWPVRGRVLASYGSHSDGSRNDGINIAAPKGTPVEAADAGVVAYTGNELRGYGNLILIKHTNGWISAYAHCDKMLVKQGEKVTRGQMIARVGSTGTVNEPQLHFELRRGRTAVDPREYLAPLPVATKDAEPG